MTTPRHVARRRNPVWTPTAREVYAWLGVLVVVFGPSVVLWRAVS